HRLVFEEAIFVHLVWISLVTAETHLVAQGAGIDAAQTIANRATNLRSTTGCDRLADSPRVFGEFLAFVRQFLEKTRHQLVPFFCAARTFGRPFFAPNCRPSAVMVNDSWLPPGLSSSILMRIASHFCFLRCT